MYDNKDVVPTLKARQKWTEFYHNKRIDMLESIYLFVEAKKKTYMIKYAMIWQVVRYYIYLKSG